MKINSVTVTNLRVPVKQKKQDSNDLSFKGIVGDGIVAVMDGIERGGIAASFTVQDMFGTNFPRTYNGLQRNRDITGEYNFQEAKEVALREFITGPSMFLIPLAILFGVRNLAGTAYSVPGKRIEAFSNILTGNDELKNILVNTPDEFKSKYYASVFRNILSSSTTRLNDAELDRNANYFAEQLIAIESAKPKNVYYSIINKKVPGSRQDLIAGLEDSFLALTKASDGEKTKNLYVATISGNSKPIASAKLANMMTSLSDYTKDLLKTGKKKLKSTSDFDSFISSFTKNRIGGRVILNFLLCGSVIAFCTTIPKIYMRSKKFPGLKGLDVDSVNAQNNNSKNVSAEVKNENK